MPPGVEVTVPVPVPAFVTVSVRTAVVNVAVTPAAAVIDTVHEPVPVQPLPDQPVNALALSGVAVSVTDVPWSKLAEVIVQPAPHEIAPAGDVELTVPPPVPTL